MDFRYYEILRQASQEDFYRSITDSEDELYDIVWDLFDKLVIEPAEVFDSDFRDNNQFRYNLDHSAKLEFFPAEDYFRRRIESNPFKDDSDAAGIHLYLTVDPSTSCLFRVGMQIWGASERQAFRELWKEHRPLLSELFRRVKPMIQSLLPFPALEHARSIDEMLEDYFQIRDPDHYLSLHYPFARVDEADAAQNFMVVMALLYHSIRDLCRLKADGLENRYVKMRRFFSGHIPELPFSLPCVDLAIATDVD